MGNATTYLAGALEQALGGALPVGVRTRDGGCAGPDTGPTVVLRRGGCWSRGPGVRILDVGRGEENRMGVDQIVAVA